MDHAAHSQLRSTLSDRWEQVLEIPNGVDPNQFKPCLDAALIRERLDVPPGSKAILFIGTLDPTHWYRHLDLLIQAITKLTNNMVHLLVVGDGIWMKKYQRIALQSGMSSQIHYLGATAQENLAAYYRAAFVTVLPSQVQESFGLGLIESLTCDTPVIASDLPGVRMLVDHGSDGFLVAPGGIDDLTRTLAEMLNLSGAARQEMGKSGRQKVVERYDWNLAGIRLENLYHQVLN